MQQAASLYNAELQRQMDREKKISDKSITVAASQAAKSHNMIGNVPTDDFRGFLGQIEGIKPNPALLTLHAQPGGSQHLKRDRLQPKGND